MVDLHNTIVTALNTIGLPVHYEMSLKSGLATPCISYMELTDYVQIQTDITDVCSVSYQIKVWGYKMSELQTYAAQVDSVMRGLNFKRTGSAELYDNQSTMKQKILTYEGLVKNDFTPTTTS